MSPWRLAWLGLAAVTALLFGTAAGVWHAHLSRSLHTPQPTPLHSAPALAVLAGAEAVASSLARHHPASGPTQSQPGPRGPMCLARPEAAPAWAVRYGDEFWRRSAPAESGAGPVRPRGPWSAARLSDAISRAKHAFQPDGEGGSVQAGDFGYTAKIGPDGFTFIAAACAGRRSVAARFETRAVRSGTAPAAAVEPAAWTVLGDTAQRLLDSDGRLLEHCQARREGVEWTWVLARAPTTPGELEIQVDCTGLRAGASSASGLHLEDADGLARVRVGPALAVDQLGRSWPIPVVGAGGTLRFKVSESILAQAHFPLALDPILSAEFGCDQPVDGPAPCTRAAPAVAANHDLFLAVWTHGQSDTTAPGVYAARVDAAGHLLDHYGIRLSSLAGEQTVCSVAANAGAFLVAWSAPHTNSTTDWDILGARVLADGTVLDAAPLPICTPNTSLQASPAAAANGENFLVVWRDSRFTGIYGTIVNPSGQLSVSNGFPISTAANEQYTPAVAALGTNYLVAWQDYRSANLNQFTSDIYAARVSGGGVLLDTNGIAVCTRTNSQLHPAVAANGSEYLVVWEDYDRAGDDILGARVSPDGVLLDTNAIVIAHSPNLQANPAAVDTAGEFLVVWQDYGLTGTNTFAATTYGARVQSDGSVSDPGGVRLSDGTGGQWYPAVARRQSDFLVLWQEVPGDAASTGSDILGAMVDVDSNIVASNELRVSGAVNAELLPVVAANGSNSLVVWTETRQRAATGLDIYAIRLGADGTTLDPVAIPICTNGSAQSDPAVAANGADYLVVWTDWRNSPTNAGHGDIFGSLIGADGTVRLPGGGPMCTATNDQSLPAVAAMGTNFLVVWQDARSTPTSILRYDIYGTRVSAQGLVLDPAGIAICTNNLSQTNPAVAANVSQALVVWTDTRNVGVNTDIYGARLDADGNVLDTNGIAICTANLIQAVPAVASDGRGYLVVWADSRKGAAYGPDIYAAQVGADGGIQPANGFPVAVGASLQTAPAVGFNGWDYLVAWQEAPVGASNAFGIFAAGVTPQGVPFSSPALPVATNLPAQLAPAVAAGADGRFLILHQGFRFEVYRAAGHLVDLEAIPRLELGARLADGRFQCRLRGAPGSSYAIQGSEDLAAWTTLETIVCTNFSTLWTDPAATNRLQRFYRAYLLP